jgi:hypothetical protein
LQLVGLAILPKDDYALGSEFVCIEEPLQNHRITSSIQPAVLIAPEDE